MPKTALPQRIVLREFKPRMMSRHAQIDVISTRRGGKSHVAVMIAHALRFNAPHVVCAGLSNANLYENVLGARNKCRKRREEWREGADAVVIDSMNYDKAFMKSLSQRAPVFRIIAHPTLAWSPSGRHCDYTIIPRRYYSAGKHIPDRTSNCILQALPDDDHLCLVVDRTADNGELKYWWYKAPPLPRSSVSTRLAITDDDLASRTQLAKDAGKTTK